MWLSPLGVPCISPPWGYLAATDLRTGNLLWSQPLGTGYFYANKQTAETNFIAALAQSQQLQWAGRNANRLPATADSERSAGQTASALPTSDHGKIGGGARKCKTSRFFRYESEGERGKAE